MKLDIYLHDSNRDLEKKVDKILYRLEQIMAKVDELRAELAVANEVTNEIAADVDDLVSKLDGGLTEAEAEQVKAELATLSSKLKNVAATHTP